METVGSAGDWDRENKNHGPAIGPLLGWQKFCPGWKHSLIGNDPKSLHQQETPTVSSQEPWLEDRMIPKRDDKELLSLLSTQIPTDLFYFCSPDSSAVTSDQMNILVCSHESQSHDQISLITLALEQQVLCGEISCCYILFKFRKSSQFGSLEHQMFCFIYFSYILRLQQSQQDFMRIIKYSLLCFERNKKKKKKVS